MKAVDKLARKEEKWGSHRDETMCGVERFLSEGWVAAYTDGSAKQVHGWMQAGYGVFYAIRNERKFSAHVQVTQRQSRGVAVSSVRIRDNPPPPPPALRAHLVTKGQ